MESFEQSSATRHSPRALLSVIVPCFDECDNLRDFMTAVHEQLDTVPDLDVEFRFVDDGSQDGTLDLLNQLHAEDPNVHYLSFSRHFGKEAAMLAGLQSARGEYLVIMDADLQDPPELLPQMLAAVRQGDCDCVATRRLSREGEPWLRSVCARFFYWFMSQCTQIAVVSGARDYRLMNRRFADAVLTLPESSRFSKGLFNWVGFKVKWLEFANREGRHATSRWSFKDLCAYAIDAIVAFSAYPLLVSFFVGLFIFLFALGLGLKTIIKTLFFNEPIQGYTTIIVCITLFSALQFLFFGIIGLYISKIYQEVKKRPVYIVAKEI